MATETSSIIGKDGHPEDKDFHTAFHCKNCDDIIMSIGVHRLVKCSCFKEEADTPGICIDGGFEYLRGGGNLSNIESLVVKIR